MAAQKDRHKAVHHLSARNYDGTGWIESISNLTEENPATGLLIDKSAAFRVRTVFGHAFSLSSARGPATVRTEYPLELDGISC